MEPRKALVILSGGQDSTTCLFWALAKYDEVHAITFDYGQKHRAEINAAMDVAAFAGISDRHEIVNIQGVLDGESPLVNPAEQLEQYETPEQMAEVIGDRREATFVPMRNALFLCIAANRAELLGADLVIGVSQADNANYDDCRIRFIDAAWDFINTALGHDHRGTRPINIETPLITLSKRQSIKLALELPRCYEALAWSHTSYAGEYPPTDMNHANVLRAQGFAEAGVPDPLVVRAWFEGAMELPESSNYDELRGERDSFSMFEECLDIYTTQEQ